jgi:hypothetical protein
MASNLSNDQIKMEKQISQLSEKAMSFFTNKTMMIYIVIIIFLFLLFTYVFVTLRKRSYNCSVLKANSPQNNTMKITELTDFTTLKNKTLKEFYIKTAYNCCCAGNLKNDYVDTCALSNCANFGVRALDFQIYSLNNHPVISASSLSPSNGEQTSFKYKEIYNSLPFGETMDDVKRIFLNDQNNCNNTTDPLFLIFRLYTNRRSTIDEMYDSLLNTFDKSKYLFYMPSNSITLDDIKLNDVMGKVVIIVDSTGVSNYSSSKLNKITSLNLGTQTNKIYRESEMINELKSDQTYGTNIFSTNLNLLYPDLNGNVQNYDSITSGINSSVSFIAMNYQLNDEYLIQFENKFKSNNENKTTSMVYKKNISIE